MRLRVNSLIVAAIVVAASCAPKEPPATPQATAPVDLSGDWVIDPARSTATGGGQGEGRGGGRPGGGGGLSIGPSPAAMTIVQTARTMTITEMRGDVQTQLVLTFDGSVTPAAIAAGGNAGRQADRRSTWRNGRLVSMFTMSPRDGGTRSYTEQRFLDGDALVLEITAARSPSVRRSVYVRKPK